MMFSPAWLKYGQTKPHFCIQPLVLTGFVKLEQRQVTLTRSALSRGQREADNAMH